MSGVRAADIARFDAGTLPPGEFDHRAHVAMAFVLLGRAPFHEVVARYARGARGVAARAGRADVFSETVTIAFLALVAEAMERRPTSCFDDFARASPDLFDRTLLERYYNKDKLHSPAARTRFLMPDKAAIATVP